MDISVSVAGGSTRVVLSGEMTIYAAAQAKEPLVAAVRDGTDIDFDLSGVSEIDSSGFQLLILSKREAERLGKTLHLSSHSPAVLAMMELYNTAGFFGDPLVIPAHRR